MIKKSGEKLVEQRLGHQPLRVCGTYIPRPLSPPFCMLDPMAKSPRRPELVALGTAFRAARTAAGLSQEGFALEADLDRSYVGAIERGTRNVSYVGLAKRLAKLVAAVRDD